MASKPSLKLQGVVKKIESPLAKYNSSGQLTCVVCNMVIKSEMVWTAHVNGRQHREKVASLKNNKPEPVFTKPQNVPMKRKAESSSTSTPPSASPSKKGVPADFFDNHPPASTASSGSFPIKSILKNSSKTQYVNINEIVKSKPAPSTTEDMDTNEIPEAQPQVAVIHHSVAVSNQPDVIPEGFFDDPKMDAKVFLIYCLCKNNRVNQLLVSLGSPHRIQRSSGRRVEQVSERNNGRSDCIRCHTRRRSRGGDC